MGLKQSPMCISVVGGVIRSVRHKHSDSDNGLTRIRHLWHDDLRDTHYSRDLHS